MCFMALCCEHCVRTALDGGTSERGVSKWCGHGHLNVTYSIIHGGIVPVMASNESKGQHCWCCSLYSWVSLRVHCHRPPNWAA